MRPWLYLKGWSRKRGHERALIVIRPGLPIFADDIQKVKDGWKLLLDKGAKMVYPAHGNPFSAKIMQKVL